MIVKHQPFSWASCLFVIAGAVAACDGGPAQQTGGGGQGEGGSGAGATTASTTTSTMGGTGGGTGGSGGIAPGCGNDIAEADEECDGTDFKAGDCTLFGYSKGAGLACTVDCKLDISGCKATCDGALLEPGETCDGNNLGDHDCTEFGFTSPAGAKCNATCSDVTIGTCGPSCDGQGLEVGEACDGADLGGLTCVDFGFDNPAGLACDSVCEHDFSGCVPSCDGNAVEPGEPCDGDDLQGKTCVDFGFVAPAGLACVGCAFDQSGCQPGCGNGVVEPGEACDTTAPAGQACTPGCTLVFTTKINEILYDRPGADTGTDTCFIELKGEPGLDLTGYSLQFINGADGNPYVGALSLNGMAIGASGYFVVAESAAFQATLPAMAGSVVSTKADMQNGPDNLVLVFGGNPIDAVGYGNFTGAIFVGEGSPSLDPADSDQSLCRLPNGADTNNNAVDFALCTATPGAANVL